MKRVLLAMGLGFALVAGAHVPPSPEYVLKAKILLVLLPYVRWPGQDAWGERPFQVAVLGQSPFGPHLDEASRNLTVHRRTVQIRYIGKPGEAEGCQVLFICASERYRLQSILGWARGKPVLTMADDEDLLSQGVMVNLLLEGAFVRLAVNPDAAGEAGIFLGSQLLRNARILTTRRVVP
jgi:hypothetical protein